MSINLKGRKAAVLAALYNNSRSFGMGLYDPADMTEVEAQAMLDEGRTYFDYLKGRVMKVDLSGDELIRTDLYNRDNGRGAAERVADSVEAQG